MCARLAYHTLSKDPNEPKALRALSDVLCGDLIKQSGWEQLSAAVLEYALRPGSPLQAKELESLDNHLFLAKWSWAFVRKRNGKTTASWEELHDRSLFVLDEDGYRTFLAGILDRCGSLEASFRVAHTLAGIMGGLLTHKTLGQSAPIEEVFQPDLFGPTDQYADWLESDTANLDELEKERQKRSSQNPNQAGSEKAPWWKFWKS